MRLELSPSRGTVIDYAVPAGFAAAAAAAMLLAMREPLIPLALVYSASFLVLAWRRTDWALLLTFAPGIFPYDVGGGSGIAIGLGEVNLVFVTLVLLVRIIGLKQRIPFTPIVLPVMLYFGICIFSSMQTWHGKYAIVSLVQMAIYFLVAVTVFAYYPRQPADFEMAFNGLIVGAVFLSIACLASGNYVFGLHKNAIGGALSYAALVCAERWFSARDPSRRTLFGVALLILTAGLFYSLSRGGWMCAITGLLVLVTMRRKFGLLLKMALVLVPVIVFCWRYLPEESRDYAFTFSSERSNVSARFDSIDYAWQQFSQSPVVGFGVGLRKMYDATNIVLLTAAETGLAGLAMFLLIHLFFFYTAYRAQRLLPRDHPASSLVAIGAALVAGKFVHGCVDHYWSRGSLLVVWGAAGMVIFGYNLARARRAALQSQAQSQDPVVTGQRV